jgi:hypothetical protein
LPDPSNLEYRFFLTSTGAVFRSTHVVGKPLWTTVAVRIDENQYLGNVERLVLLFRWFRGDAPPEVLFLDPVTGGAFESPSSVHWDGFPLQQAMDSSARRGSFSAAGRRRSGTALDRVERCDTWMATPAAPKQRSSPPPPGDKALHWSALRVWSDGRQREVLILDEQRRITELFRWKRGRPTPGIWVVDIATGSALADPDAVVWDGFPEPLVSGVGG